MITSGGYIKMYLMSNNILDDLCLQLSDALAETCDKKKNEILSKILISLRDSKNNNDE